MKKISEVREKRQERFWELRMAKARGAKVAADRKELEQQIHLVKVPTEGAAEAAKDKVAVEEAAAEAMQE